jgi:hypothetical protein
MRSESSETSRPKQLLVAFTVILLVSGGLCGLQVASLGFLPQWAVGPFMLVGVAEIFLIPISAAGMVVAAAWWGIAAIRGPQQGVVSLFDTVPPEDGDNQEGEN